MRRLMAAVDRELAEFYAPGVLGSLKLGENRICIWFPGSGKLTVLGDILGSGDILRQYLGELYRRTVFIRYSGMGEIGGDTAEKCRRFINLGKEIVLVGNEIDSLPEAEYRALLARVVDIVSVNPRRIRSIINIVNRQMWERAVMGKPEIMLIAQKTEYMPVISGSLLAKYIRQRNKEFGQKLAEDDFKRILTDTGGILQLTKEVLRNYGNTTSELELKLTTIWSRLPKDYREAILNYGDKETASTLERGKVLSELKRLGVLGLKIFGRQRQLLTRDHDGLLKRKLSVVEGKIYEKLKKSKEGVGREELGELVWEGKSESYSDWALDKIISRLRNKLRQCGIDPQRIRTLKGRGYQWRRE